MDLWRSCYSNGLISYFLSAPNDPLLTKKNVLLFSSINEDEDFMIQNPSGFCYNSKTGEVFGRSISSWTKLIVFMTLYSAGVALFWGLCLWVFYQVSSD